MVEELEKFIKALDKMEKEWVDASDPKECRYHIDRVHFEHLGQRISVVNGFGTYGGYSLYYNKNNGLLEVMIGNQEPKGWLTCEEAIKYIFGGNNGE